jgi:hypothetical protein
MKKVLLIGFVITMAMTLLFAADQGKKYGEGVTLEKTTEVSDLVDNPDKYVGKKVQISGTVVSVCEHRGCWIDIAGKRPYEKMRIKVEDGVIVFPMTAKGKSAHAEGVFEALQLSKEQAIAMRKHQAEERGEEFDPSSITGPVTIYQIKGTGAVIE